MLKTTYYLKRLPTNNLGEDKRFLNALLNYNIVLGFYDIMLNIHHFKIILSENCRF